MKTEPNLRHKSDRGHILPRLLAAIMVAAFVVCGVRGLRVARSRRTEGSGTLNSSDRYLLEALHVNQGGEKVMASISDVPPLEPLAIIAPDDNIYGPLLLDVIGSVTWPHPIYLVQVGNGDVRKTLDVLRNDHFAAGLFYDLAPPVLNPANRRIGLLTVVPISK
jgi:hypothetical protein